MKPSSPLSDYYNSIQLSPVEHDIGNTMSFLLHEKKRKNLLGFYLKLPMTFWGNLNVLEFGPGSGENATVAAKYGAKFTFVEPLPYLIDKLQGKFKQLGLQDSIETIHNNTLENFETNERYPLVMAEGFVQFLDAPGASIRKMMTYVAPEGFLVISVVHPSGTFIEFVKKVLLMRMIALEDAKTHAEESACAAALFLEDFEKINHSRGFESWIRDTVLNPVYRNSTFIGLDECMRELPNDCYLYSSWPNYINSDDLVWHKTVKNKERIRADTLDSYYARFPSYIDSIPRSQKDTELFSPDSGRRIAELLSASLAKMDAAIIDHRDEALHNTVHSLEKLRTFLMSQPAGEKPTLILNETIELFKEVLGSRNREAFASAYKRRTLLRQCWGSPGHYMVFQKTNLFE